MNAYRERPIVAAKIIRSFWKRDGEIVESHDQEAEKTLENLLSEGWVIAGQSEQMSPSGMGGWTTWTLIRT